MKKLISIVLIVMLMLPGAMADEIQLRIQDMTDLGEIQSKLDEGMTIDKVYYTDGYGFSTSEFTTINAVEIESLWNAVNEITVLGKINMGITDWYPQIIFYLSDGTQGSVHFESTWLNELEQGCRRIGRNLNDTRGLIHSFRDCRETMRRLFEDLREMSSLDTSSWEIVFELRLNLRRMIRIYADVLVITPERVFPLEFKMKNAVDPDEVLQAAKYVPFLEILFGPGKDIYPALVLTSASELFTEAQIGKTDCLLPVCSGDMLFNVFNEVIGFLG